jgi:hypothetical protein
MIDLKQFEGHTEGPWVIVPCDISKSELKKLSGGVHALFPRSNLEEGETKALCILSAFTEFSEEDQSTWKLMQKAPELLEEVKSLQHENFFLKQDIEEIEEREGEEIHSEKVWRSYVKEYFDSLDEMVQESKIELANSELSNDRFEKATQRLKLLAGLSPEKSTGAKLNFESGVFIEKDGRFD